MDPNLHNRSAASITGIEVRLGGTVTEQQVSDGLITVESEFAVPETMDRFAAAVTRAGLLVFARIDHGQGARDAGLELRPTELLIFGHPRGGTPLMMESQQAGIDLPFKALSWEDEDGRVWLAWNDPGWLACRHRLGTASAPAVQAIADGMNGLALAAAHALSETDLPAAELPAIPPLRSAHLFRAHPSCWSTARGIPRAVGY